jgi:hypothetical protein
MVACGSSAVKITNRALGAGVLRFAGGYALGPLLVARCSGKVFAESAMATNRQQVVCSQCDKPEEYCTCEKYCTICKGQLNIRLGVDGLYYCPDCREACDVALANDR